MNRLIAFVATAKPDESRAFYRDVLGLTLVEESEFSIVFTSGETMLRVQKVDSVAPSTDTVLGWEVDSVEYRIVELSAKGVTFEHFDGLPHDEAATGWRPTAPKSRGSVTPMAISCR